MSTLSIQSTVPLSSGRQIPRLGFGVYQISKQDTKATVVEALRVGYRHIDTAQLYRNEKEVGEAIRESGIPRGEIYLTTKISSRGQTYNSATKAVDDALERLGDIGYIDLFLIHEPIGGQESREAIWKALLDAKKAGKIRDAGVSNYNIKHLEEIRSSGLELPVVNQIELHPLNQQKPIVQWCRKHGIAVEAYCPIIRGRFDIPVLQDLVRKYDKDPAQVLIRWSLQRDFIPLPRSSKLERIRSNANVYDFELSEEDMGRLDDLDEGTAGAISWNPVDVD